MDDKPQILKYPMGMLEISRGRGTFTPVSVINKGYDFYSDIEIIIYSDRIEIDANKHTSTYHYDNNKDRRFNFNITNVEDYENKYIITPEDYYYKASWDMRRFKFSPKRCLKKGWYQDRIYKKCIYTFLDKSLLIRREYDNKTR